MCCSLFCSFVYSLWNVLYSDCVVEGRFKSLCNVLLLMKSSHEMLCTCLICLFWKICTFFKDLKPLRSMGITENISVGKTKILKRCNLILGWNCWNLCTVLLANLASGILLLICLLKVSLLSKVTPKILQSCV